jgi:hypothetical protein
MNGDLDLLLEFSSSKNIIVIRRNKENIDMNNKWIPVTERYPKDGEQVFYYFEDTGISIGQYQKLSAFKCEQFELHPEREGHVFIGKGIIGKGFLTDDVTHWMPWEEGMITPPAPKGTV